MCGFRPLVHLYYFLSESSPAYVPELRGVVGAALCDAFVRKFVADDDGVNADADYGHDHDGLHHHLSLPRMRFCHADSEGALRQLYTALMTASHDVVAASLHALVHRLRGIISSGGIGQAWASLVLDLFDQYGVDIGIFSLFFFNVLSLQCGDAMFLAPCLPHAYIRWERPLLFLLRLLMRQLQGGAGRADGVQRQRCSRWAHSQAQARGRAVGHARLQQPASSQSLHETCNHQQLAPRLPQALCSAV